MIIKKINIAAFGKLHAQTIEFSEGLNVIYGGNEAGKTTLHKFIEGMFFGFFKTYSKNKLYTDDYAKYTPWTSGEYQGSIEYEHEGKTYRLERNFDKRNESVRLYDIATGDDLSEKMEYDSVQKLYDASLHLGINRSLFNNTVSIAQMANATDDDLKREIGDLLVNTGDAHDSNISFKKAVEILDRHKAAIGTKRQTRSAFGSNIAKLQQLEEEKQFTQNIYEENKEKYLQIKALENELEKTMQKKEQIITLQETRSAKEASEKYERYIALQEEIDELQKKQNQKMRVDDSDYEIYQEASAKYDICRDNLDELQSKRTILERQLVTLNIEISAFKQQQKEVSADEMMQDASLLTHYTEKLEALQEKKETDEDPGIAKRYRQYRKIERILSMSGTATLMIAAILAGVGYFVEPMFYYGAIGLGAIGIACLAFWAFFSSKSSALEPKFERYDTLMSRTVNMIIMCEVDIDQLKQKYECQTVEELTELLQDAQNTNQRQQGFEKEIEEYQNKLKEIENEYGLISSDMEQYRSTMDDILEKANVDTLEELKLAIQTTRQQGVVQAKLDAAKSAAQELLKDTTLEQLRTLSKKADDSMISGEQPLEEIMPNAMEIVNDEILRITSSISSLEGSVKESENAVRALNEIDEEIADVSQKIEGFEIDLNAYELAEEKMQEISKHFHSDFASEFNAYISEIVKRVTYGKYSDVKVNDQMQIKVMDASSDKLVDISALSGGTMDQLYFAVRFAIMDLIIQQKNVPVLLDDCFLQYDDTRLNNILSFIAEKSKERQILLFTCRLTEKELLKSTESSFRLIEL